MTGAPAHGVRECGSCTLCCKLLTVRELDKPSGTWCEHVAKGAGCSIYQSRPSECSSFGCGYLHWPEAGEYWFPARCKMVIFAQDATRMVIQVDPSTPNVWKLEPYYSDIKRWAWQAAQTGTQQLVIVVGKRMIAVLPDREVDLGVVAEDEYVVIQRFDDGSYGATRSKVEGSSILRFPGHRDSETAGRPQAAISSSAAVSRSGNSRQK